MTTLRSFWGALGRVARAVVVGAIGGAALIGFVMVATMTAFDWFAHWKLVLFCWPFLGAGVGLAFYADPEGLLKRIADKV